MTVGEMTDWLASYTACNPGALAAQADVRVDMDVGVDCLRAYFDRGNNVLMVEAMYG